jgi:hypothetical protein
MADIRPTAEKPTAVDDFQKIVPPLLMALGALSLLRSSRTLSVAIIGAWLYGVATKSDGDRHGKRMAGESIDQEMEDSFPASDPPSFSGSTAGAP